MIDTNAAIELVTGRLPSSGEAWLEKVMATEEVYISIVNRIEMLGFNGLQPEMEALRLFVKHVEVVPLSDAIADEAIAIRKSRKIKLPDAIIAATAVTLGLRVISRNEKDFSGIQGVVVVNPHDI